MVFSARIETESWRWPFYYQGLTYSLYLWTSTNFTRFGIAEIIFPNNVIPKIVANNAKGVFFAFFLICRSIIKPNVLQSYWRFTSIMCNVNAFFLVSTVSNFPFHSSSFSCCLLLCLSFMHGLAHRLIVLNVYNSALQCNFHWMTNNRHHLFGFLESEYDQRATVLQIDTINLIQGEISLFAINILIFRAHMQIRRLRVGNIVWKKKTLSSICNRFWQIRIQLPTNISNY